MKKQVVLIYSKVNEYRRTIPYSLLFLEKAISDIEDIDVVLFDENFDINIFEYIIENKDDILFVGFSVLFSYQVIAARELATRIKEKSNIPILFGGPFVTYFSKETISENFVDYIIFGQGEYALRDFVFFMLNKNNILLKEKADIFLRLLLQQIN